MVIPNRFSMRTSLVCSILAMGILGLLLTFITSEVYRHLMLDAQRATMVEYLRAATDKLRDEFEIRTRAIAQHAQADDAFVKAVATKQRPALTRQLDALHKYAVVASGESRVHRLYLVDEKLGLMATSTLGAFKLWQPPCSESLARMVSTPGRNPAVHRPCFIGDRPYHVDIVPLQIQGGGYLVVVGDLVPGLSRIEQELATPLRLRRTSGAVIYQSADWPDAKDMGERAVATYSIYASAPTAVPLEMQLAKDMSAFYAQLKNVRYLVLLSVTIVTSIAIFIALFALERTALKPLRLLATQLQRIRQDKHNLGEPVSVSGNVEVTELAEGLNEMTARLRESYENLEHMAYTDPLTDLPNRMLFMDRLQLAISGAKRESKPFALMMMDLDRFKDINDTLGHQAGDLLLIQVAQRLRNKLRASDTVARMGGDEFAVLLPAVDANHASVAARMLLQALKAPFTVGEHSLSIGGSIGIALFPDNGVDANVLMQRADVAMYAAKGDGGGFAFYSPSIDENYPKRLTLLNDLREAVENEQFELHYQPIISLAQNRVAGIEALVRWRHPRDGMLLPESFLPMMEHSGLIRSLMPWVVNEALARARALQTPALPLTLSVNISMSDLHDAYIADFFAEQLKAHRVDPSSIMVEITESMVMTDAPRTLELLSQLASMGLRLAIDDFGMGYSSLSYLKKLPVTTLKIDKSFVTGMTSDENDAAIVRTSIDLAHNFGLEVIAEGVESEAAFTLLRQLNCNLAQGNHLSRPLTAAELDEWLAQSAWGVGGGTVVSFPTLLKGA